MDTSLIQKNSGFFSFSDSVADLAINRKFMEGYGELLDGKHNENTFIWEALSAIGNEIGETVYENVLNYIQNVADINTCSIKSICSISKMMGDESYEFMGKFSNIPVEIQKLLDIFSINKAYLFDKNVLAMFPKLVIELSAHGIAGYVERLNELSSCVDSQVLSSELSNVSIKNFISTDFYESFVSSVFYDVLTSNLYVTYDGKEDYIYKNLSAGITTLSNFTSEFLNDPCRQEIENLQNFLDIPRAFKPFEEADKYESGEKEWSDFTSDEKTLISRVRSFRAMPKFDRISSPNGYCNLSTLTKYSYYSEKKFFDFVSFIEQQYIFKGKFEVGNSYYDLVSGSKEYYLNRNYTELGVSKDDEKSRLFVVTDNGPELDIEKVQAMSRVLRDICFAIVDIRERLKTSAQRNQMRGTFLLISYLVNQYLKRNLPLQYPELSGLALNFKNEQDTLDKDNSDVTVKIQEYEDNTEYFNLSSEFTDKAFNGETAVMPFWKADAEDNGIDYDEINDFYLATMNLQNSLSTNERGNKDPRDFLDILFDCGATKTYISDVDKTTVIPGIVAEDYVSEVEKDPSLSTNYYEVALLQREMFLKFNGTSIGYTPYFNYKNIAQSSYQIHPFLWKFTEYEGLKSTVQNAYYNSANEDIMKILMSPMLSVHLGDLGQILNIWKDDVFDFSGYRSRYENGSHSIKNGILEHYDGLWYPDAIKDYFEEKSTTSGFYGLLYSVKEKLTSEDVCELCKSENFLSDTFENEYLSNIFSYYIDYNSSLSSKLDAYNTARIDGSLSEEDLENLSSDIDGFIESRKKTFFEKWYNYSISKKEAEYTEKQLSVYGNKLSVLYTGVKSSSTGNISSDIYKYGIDKYGNSIMLIKWYDISSSYQDKKDIPGELWIRKNASPIGFPAFDIPSSVPQVREEGMNNELKTYISTNIDDNSLDLFYDFDITNDYRYMVLASKYDKDAENAYISSQIFLLEPYEDTNKYDFDESEYVYSYTLRGYGKNHNLELLNPKYDFQGFYVNGDDTLILFTEYDKKNTLSMHNYLFPEDEENFAETPIIINISSDFKLDEKLSIADDPKFVYGYDGDTFTVGFLTKMETEMSVQTFQGKNFNPTSAQTLLSDITDREYGRCYDYLSVSNDAYGENPYEYTSVDRFDHYLTLVSFKRNGPDSNTYSKNYNLNSDASFIPLYCGTNGETRIWGVELYRNPEEEKSVELLGKSFQSLKSFDEEFEETIFKDEDGKLTNSIPSKLLSCISRIYENVEPKKTISKYYFQDYLGLNGDLDHSNGKLWYYSTVGGFNKIENHRVEIGDNSRKVWQDMSVSTPPENALLWPETPQLISSFVLSAIPPSDEAILKDVRLNGYVDDVITIDGIQVDGSHTRWVNGYGVHHTFQNYSIKTEISSLQSYQFTLGLYDWPSEEKVGNKFYKHCGHNECSLGDKWGNFSDVFGEDIDPNGTWLGSDSFDKWFARTNENPNSLSNYVNQFSAYVLYDKSNPFLGLATADGNIIYVSEYNSNNTGYISASYDGGKTWKKTGAKNIGWGALATVDNRTVYVCGVGTSQGTTTSEDSKYPWKTTDFGNTWKRLSNAPLNSFDVETIDGTFVFLTKLNDSPVVSETLYKSIDGGETWDALPATGLTAIRDPLVAAHSKNTVYVTGGWNIDSDKKTPHKIYKSSDGGNSFNVLQNSSEKIWIAIETITDDIVVAVSEDGMMYITADGGTTWALMNPIDGNSVKLFEPIWGLASVGAVLYASVWEGSSGIQKIARIPNKQFGSPLCVVWEWEVPSDSWRNDDNTIPELFASYTNPKLNNPQEENGREYLLWEQPLMSNITYTTVPDYTLWIYNTDRGLENPIYKGDLTACMFGNTYLSTNSIDELLNQRMYGTPDIFEYGKDVSWSNFGLNFINNINEIKLLLNDTNPYTLSVQCFKTDSEIENVIGRGKLVAMVFNKTLAEYGDFHFLEHHDIWPYNKIETNYDINNPPLEDIYSFKDNYAITTNTLAFKINEESPDIDYPSRAVYDTLAELFSTKNITPGELTNIFDLSNTYIFEVDPPKSIADIIDQIDIAIYPDTDETIDVYEEYVSDQNKIDINDPEIFYYIDFLEINESGKTSIELPDELFEECITLPEMLGVATDISGYYASGENSPQSVGAIDKRTIKVDENSIKNFMKIYINYFVEDDTGAEKKIHLYFNYNNLFCSPYNYQRRDGNFYTEFKPETYLHLAPGENGTLTIVLQAKWYDSLGILHGVKDIPVIRYRIWNVSDDKPKFIIKNIWTISRETLAPIRDASVPVDLQNGILTISENTEKTGKFPPSQYLYDSFVLMRDVEGYANVMFETESPLVTIRSLTCDFIYEYQDPDVEFVPTKSKGGSFSEYNGKIRAILRGGDTERLLCFRLKKGATIDDETGIRQVPIDAINMSAVDTVGNFVKMKAIPGAINFNFTMDGTIPDQLLAKERETTPDNFNGYILTENRHVIKIFQNKRLSIFS